MLLNATYSASFMEEIAQRKIAESTTCKVVLRGRAVEGKFATRPFRMYLDIRYPTSQDLTLAIIEVEQRILSSVNGLKLKWLVMYLIARGNPHLFENRDHGYCYQREPHDRNTITTKMSWIYSDIIPPIGNLDAVVRFLHGRDGRGVQETIRGTSCSLKFIDGRNPGVKPCFVVGGDTLEETKGCVDRVYQQIRMVESKFNGGR